MDLTNGVQDLTHGLYNGFIDEKLSIDENSGGAFNVIPGSNLTFGSTFKTSSKNIDVNINVDKNIEVVPKDIKVYKLEGGNFVELTGVISKDEDNKFNIKIDQGNNYETEILIVYKGVVNKEINNDYILINNISVGENSKKVYMKTPSNDEPKLPDLF